MIRSIFTVTNVTLVLLIAYGHPFVSVLRGQGLKQVVKRSWVLLLIYMTGLCIGIPGLVGAYSHELSREMLRSWVPEGEGVLLVAILGWLPPLIAGSIALLVRWVLQRWWRRSDNSLQYR